MGHLPIVNQSTVTDVIRDGFASTRGNLKEEKNWVKTTADIFSDMLTNRKGDPIFPWIIKGKGRPGIGFKYIFTVAGPPVFVPGEEYPVKVPLERTGLEYPNALPEVDALDLWDPKLLWNAIGKKSLGRGRSYTHQTPMEDQRLRDLLDSRNPGGPKKITLGNASYKSIPLKIDPSQDSWDTTLKRHLKSLRDYDRLSSLDLTGVPWRSDDIFYAEKVLEAWIMENIDRPSGTKFRENVLEPNLEIEWFANYLPFGVAGGNIDVVVIQSSRSRKVVTVIELKVGKRSLKDFKADARQLNNYCKFITDAFNAYGERVEVKGVLISGPSRQLSGSEATEVLTSGVKWVIYDIDDANRVNFKSALSDPIEP